MPTKTSHWIFATTVERDGQLDAVEGDLAYCRDTDLTYAFDGSSWGEVGGSSPSLPSLLKPDDLDECGPPIARYLLELPDINVDDGPNGLDLTGMTAPAVRARGLDGSYLIGATGAPGTRNSVSEVAYVGEISFRWLGTFEGSIQGCLVTTRQYGIEADADGTLFLRRSTNTTTGSTPAVNLGVGAPGTLTETVVVVGDIDSGGVGNQTFDVYMNGQPMTSGTFPNAVLRSSNPDQLAVAGTNGILGNSSFEWKGSVFYVEIFDNALDAADILASYTRRIGAILG